MEHMSEEVKVTETENAVDSAAKESDKIDEAIAQPDETPEKQGILEETLKKSRLYLHCPKNSSQC